MPLSRAPAQRRVRLRKRPGQLRKQRQRVHSSCASGGCDYVRARARVLGRSVGRRGLDMRAGRSKRRGWAKPLRRRGLQPSAVSHRAGAAVLEGQARRGRQCMLGGCRQLDGNAACMQLLDAFRRASLLHCACERYCKPAHRCCCARRTPTAAAGVCQRRRCCKDQEGGAGVDLRRRSVDASV